MPLPCLFLISDIAATVQKYGGPKMIWVVIWAKIWDISPLVNKGQHWSNACGYFMSIAWGPTVGVVLAGACWAWAAGTEDI